MSRFPEQRLWDRIRKNLGGQVHIERIENGVGAGTPDTLVIHGGVVTFVEHKTATLPVRETSKLKWRHELTPQQRNWHRTWFQNGGRSYIVVGIDKALYCVPGSWADRINDMKANDISMWNVDVDCLLQIYKGSM